MTAEIITFPSRREPAEDVEPDSSPEVAYGEVIRLDEVRRHIDLAEARARHPSGRRLALR
jgi:hypothetical protein